MKHTRESVNQMWADFEKIHYLDPPTPKEAEKAARKLYRFAMGETWQGTVTLHTGNSRTYVTERNIRIGYEQGWRNIILDLAWSLTRDFDSVDHYTLAARMTKEFFKRQWWLGVLKPQPKTVVAPSKAAVRQAKIDRLNQRREAWEKKRKAYADKTARAATALGKINRSLAAYERLITKEKS